MKFETKPPQNRTITVADEQRTEIYRGTVVDLGLETMRLPNGELLNLEIVRHPGWRCDLGIGSAEPCLPVASIPSFDRQMDLGITGRRN